MTKIYACLAGNWVCLNDDPNCTISEWNKNPYYWWKEGAPLYAPIQKIKKLKIVIMGWIIYIFFTKAKIGA